MLDQPVKRGHWRDYISQVSILKIKFQLTITFFFNIPYLCAGNFSTISGFPMGGGEATGGIWILWGRGGGMMVKNVTKFHKRHLGGRGMLECVCVCVCVCRVSYRILSYGRGDSKIWCGHGGGV